MYKTCKCGLTFIGLGCYQRHAVHTWECPVMMEELNHAKDSTER